MMKSPRFTPSTQKRPSSRRSITPTGRPAASSWALNSSKVVPGAGGLGLVRASAAGRLRWAVHRPVSSSPPEG